MRFFKKSLCNEVHTLFDFMSKSYRMKAMAKSHIIWLA